MLDKLGHLQTAFEHAGGYTYHNQIETILSGLHFPEDRWTHPLVELSGGQRTRAHLACILLKNPDVLLLESGFSPDTIQILEQRGHEIRKNVSSMGSLQTVGVKDGVFRGASDPRRPNSGAFAPEQVPGETD